MRCDFNFAVTTDLRTRNGAAPTPEELSEVAQIFNDSLELVMDVHLKNVVASAHGFEPTDYQLYDQEK